MPTIAAITIGQSPRDDIVAELAELIPGATWVQAGALDRLDDAAIHALAARCASFPLVTRLRGGRTVVIGERDLEPLVQGAIGRVERQADVVLVLCAGSLAVTAAAPLVLPARLIEAAVSALAFPSLFVVTPLEGQIAAQQARWRARVERATVVCAPHSGSTDFEALGREARRTGASAVVLDCMGYPLAVKAAVARASGLPTLLVRSLAARVVGELGGV
jgi:protein AroM